MKDVTILLSLPVLGESQVAKFTISEGENKKKVDALASVLSKSKYSTNKGTYFSWVKYFTEGLDMNSSYQPYGFLAYSLNYFVFLSLENGMHSFVFPIEVLLA